MSLEAYFKITYGLYVVSSAAENILNGYVSNTVFQVTAEPARIAIACHKDNFTCGLIEKSNVFSVSVLKKDIKPELFGRFGYRSGKNFQKFSGVKYLTGITGVPILSEDTIAWFECRVQQTLDTGTHILFVGDVVAEDLLDPSGEPYTYAYFRDVKKGRAPKNSPTYIDPDKLKTGM